MRRFRDRQTARLFRSGELPRLLTMIGMLLVLGMLIRKASDVDTWRFFTGEQRPSTELADADNASGSASPATLAKDGEKSKDEGAAAQSNDASESGTAAAESAASANSESAGSESGSSVSSDPESAANRKTPETPEAEPLPDEDPEQRAAFEEEAQVLTDREPLTKEEMFAYWRLMRWADETKLSDLVKRAHTVRYGDLILKPAEHRGELIKIKLHLLQNLKEQAPPDNPAGVSTYYQAVGWNESSQAWFYFCIYADLPDGMPVGDRIEQLGTFVGYFLKTTTYQDGQGKTIQAPILIGRMIWHPVALSKPATDAWDTPWLIAGLALVWFAARFVLRMLPGRKRAPTAGILRSSPIGDEPAESVESWLDRVESEGDSEAINHPRGYESNGNGPGETLDRSDNHEG